MCDEVREVEEGSVVVKKEGSSGTTPSPAPGTGTEAGSGTEVIGVVVQLVILLPTVKVPIYGKTTLCPHNDKVFLRSVLL